MDKSIIEKLVKYGLITNIDVDANKYKDIDDLIAKGIITVPGAKTKILELVGNFITELEETIETTKTTVLENTENTNNSEDTKPEIINEVTVEDVELVVSDDPAEVETIEEVVEETVEETVAETVEENVKETVAEKPKKNKN